MQRFGCVKYGWLLNAPRMMLHAAFLQVPVPDVCCSGCRVPYMDTRTADGVSVAPNAGKRPRSDTEDAEIGVEKSTDTARLGELGSISMRKQRQIFPDHTCRLIDPPPECQPSMAGLDRKRGYELCAPDPFHFVASCDNVRQLICVG